MIPNVGDRIWLIEMPEDPSPIEFGSTGTVEDVVTIAGSTQVGVSWDSGRMLSLCIPPDRWAYLDNRDEHIAGLYVAGLTLEQVGERVGLTKQRIGQILQQRSVTTRPRGVPVGTSRRKRADRLTTVR